MNARFVRVTVIFALAASLSGCAVSSSPQRIALNQPAGSQPHVGVVQTVQDCGGDDGGFGARVRHFGNPTPFSENPFNGCWPR
jgi:hypothetical protein